ncbi:MAG: ABC transporter permease [Deferrisomatales bacterium]
MTLRDIALLNLRRRKAKAAFVMAGLVIGVSTVVGLVSLTQALVGDVEHKLEQFGANILIVPKTENLSLSYGGLSLGGVSYEVEEIREADLAKIATIKNARNIGALGPTVLGTVKSGNTRVVLAGLDLHVATMLKPWWHVTGELPPENGVLLGAGAARVLGLGVGDRFDADGWDFRVTGVLEPTGSQDDQIVFTHLASAQFALGKEGKISLIEVAAHCKDCPVEDMVVQLSEVLPGASVMAIQQVVKGRMETITHFQRFGIGVSAVVLVVGGLVVLVTMMGSVRERTSEIGIFRAIGFRKSHVARIVLLEAGIVSALAGAVGYGAGLGGSNLLLPLFTGGGADAHAAMGHAAGAAFDPALAAAALGLSVALGLLASAYPALLATRMDPNEALRAL